MARTAESAMELFAFGSGRRLLPVFVVLFLTVPAWASDSPSARATLTGITQVQVVVEPILPEVERHGLTQSQVQADVALRLKQSGITVVASSPASLRVEITLAKVMIFRVYAYSLEVAFHQPLRLDRDLTIPPVSAPTWSLSSRGTVPLQRVRELRSRVNDLVEQFLKAHLEQNSTGVTRNSPAPDSRTSSMTD